MSWDGTLSSGGVQKHGTPQHSNQGNPGTYAMPFAVSFDTAGAEAAAYQAWSATPTYPANTYVLGSDSKLYRAVISNAGNDPTTDNGTHWLRVSIPSGGSSTGQVAVWNNTTKEYEPGSAGSGVVPNGSAAGQMLYWNGTGWTVDAAGADTQTLYFSGTVPTPTSFLRSDVSNSRVLIGNPATPDANVELQVWGTGGNASASPMIEAVENASANNSSSSQCMNNAQGKGVQIGIVGTAGDFLGTTSQGDVVVRSTGTSPGPVWIGQGNTPLARLLSSDLGANKVMACTGGSNILERSEEHT